jgi:SAM-dependent methyltransferase
MDDFYDRLAPFYHLIYADWEASVARQGRQLSRLLRDTWGHGVRSVLDVSCGIGTQALGLASHGFEVTASDLSAGAVARARREAEARGLAIRFSVCDMRQAHTHHGAAFDVVLSCDNALPHLLSDEDIGVALQQLHACTRPGGGCVVSMRDYAEEVRGTGLMKPYGVREEAGRRYLVFQVWDFEGDQYDLAMYFVEEDRSTGAAEVCVLRSRYYAVSTDRVCQLMEAAGFVSVRRLDDVFFQPILVGTRPA